MLALLRELLRSTLQQERENFLTLLLGENTNGADSVRFLIEIIKGASTSVISITGDIITVGLTKDIATLIVGDPHELWWSYQYHSPGHSVSCHLLRLRAIEHPDELE